MYYIPDRPGEAAARAADFCRRVAALAMFRDVERRAELREWDDTNGDVLAEAWAEAVADGVTLADYYGAP